MATNLYKKCMIFAVIILIFIAGIIPVSANLTASSRISIVNNKENDFNPLESESKLTIKEFKGGLGLSFVIKNEGNNVVTDLKLKIRADGKYLKIISPKYIEISSIDIDESITIKIRTIGFGLGEPINYKRIIVTANATNINDMERIVVVHALGPIINVISVFINDAGSYEGYTLYSPEYFTNTYLINNSGDIINMWKSKYIQAADCYLLENGNLLRSCLPKINPDLPILGITGRIEMFNWDGDLIWEFEYSNEDHCLHHGFEILPNGNILMIAVESKTFAEAVDAGRNPLTLPARVLWPSFIIEVEPILPRGGNIVWEWHVWDHLIQDFNPSKKNYGIVRNHPELIDINSGLPVGVIDWNHVNSVDYNEKFDQILISSHVQSEIWVIDHSTTTEEAAGHTGGKYGKGGDLLYRWGNPQIYRAGDENDQWLYGQHDAQWIETGFPGEGNILVFNNGLFRPWAFYSSVDEIIPPVDENGNYFLEPGKAYGPEKPVWSYTADPPTNFYSPIMSGAQRLPNGNTLICDGYNGIFFEVTPEKEILWRFVNLLPDTINTQVSNIERYSLDYPGIGNPLVNKDDFTVKKL